MGPIPVFHGEVSDDGRLLLAAAEQGLRLGYLKRLAGKPVEVIIRPQRKRRSDQQNRWHWGVAVPLIAQELGYEKHEHADVHYALVAKCFGTKFDPKLQQEIPHVRSSGLTTAQFSELMEWEVRFAATELGLVIPMPHEVEAA